MSHPSEILRVQLKSGRELIATSLFVSYTWEGFLCRPGTEDDRELLLNASRSEAIRQYGDHLPINILGIDTVAYDAFPRVRVITCFESKPIDPKQQASGLICVWLQEELFSCPDEAALKLIMEMDWDTLAQDFCW